MRAQHVPCLINQDRFNLIDQGAGRMFDLNKEFGVGFISFSPLAQGLLTNRYLNGIPEGSRATKGRFLKTDAITDELLGKIRQLNGIATQRGQTLAEMSLAWVLNHPAVTSVIIGSSSVAQLQDNLDTLKNTKFSSIELKAIDRIVNS